MKKTMLLLTNTLRRSKMILLVAVLCGMALILLFNLMSQMTGSYYVGIPIGLLAHEETAVTQDLRAFLGDEIGMRILESDDVDYLNSELVERHISAVVEIPAGFFAALFTEAPISLQISFLDDYANALFVEGYLESYGAGLAALVSGADGDPARLESILSAMADKQMPVNVEVTNSSSMKEITQQNAFRMILGFYLMFSFLLAFVTAFQIFDDRRNGVYNRIKVTRVRTPQYLSGVCLVGLLNTFCLIGPFIVFVMVTKPSIGMHLWQMGILCFLYALFVIGVALVAALFLKSKNAITAGIVGSSTIMCLLGGAYFPITTSPLFLQRLAMGTPQFWFTNAIEILQENPSASWWKNVLVILLSAILLFILAGVRYVSSGLSRRRNV